MTMGDRGWRDSTENYADGYSLTLAGSTATSAPGQGSQPLALLGVSISVNTAAASGDVRLIDGSATGGADPEIWRAIIATGTSPVSYVAMFPRPIACNNGLVVSATTITGCVSLIYKQRYS